MLISQNLNNSHIIAVDQDSTYSVSDYNSFVKQLADLIPCRSLIFCMCSNTIESLFGYISFIESLSVPVMLDSTKSADLVKNLCSIYRPNFIWAPTGSTAYLNCDPIYTYRGYSLYRFSYANHSLYQDLALLLTTSGSTGSPKLVRLSYDNIKSNAESIAEYLTIDKNERPVTSLPMHYSYGLSVINSHLIKNATILLTDKSVMQREFWDFVKKHGATSIAGVPYTYEMLKRLRFERMDIPTLKTLTQAGGKLNPKLVNEFVEDSLSKQRRFIVMYGQTEATARMSYTPWSHAREKSESVGIAIPGGQFRLIDNSGNEINEAGIDGELIYEGPNVSLGYAENESDLTLGDLNQSVLHTGDVARRDEDGFYYITGRLKRFVKIWGNRCNLDAIEQLLKPIIPEVACVGVDDLITIFTIEEGHEATLKNTLTKKTGLNGRAFSVRVIPEIPKNESGKTLYSELQKML